MSTIPYYVPITIWIGVERKQQESDLGMNPIENDPAENEPRTNVPDEANSLGSNHPSNGVGSETREKLRFSETKVDQLQADGQSIGTGASAYATRTVSKDPVRPASYRSSGGRLAFFLPLVLMVVAFVWLGADRAGKLSLCLDTGQSPRGI